MQVARCQNLAFLWLAIQTPVYSAVVPEALVDELLVPGPVEAVGPADLPWSSERWAHFDCSATVQEGYMAYSRTDMSSQPSGRLECGELINWPSLEKTEVYISKVQVGGAIGSQSHVEALEVELGFTLNRSVRKAQRKVQRAKLTC